MLWVVALLGVRDVIQNGREKGRHLGFTKNSNLSGKCRNYKYFFASVAKYDTIKHFAAFGSIPFFLHPNKVKTRIFIQKWLDLVLLMTSYLVTIAIDCRQTLPKCVSRINEQLLKTVFANDKQS